MIFNWYPILNYSIDFVDIPENHTSEAEGTVRLMGGSSPQEGRVEVFHLNQWGTVCDDNWSIFNAFVVCRQLGYTTAVDAPVNAAFGPGRGPIWLDKVACTGEETNLSQCHHNGLADSDCIHAFDAGAVSASEGHECTVYTFFYYFNTYCTCILCTYIIIIILHYGIICIVMQHCSQPTVYHNQHLCGWAHSMLATG